jgi:hypothetical protein
VRILFVGAAEHGVETPLLSGAYTNLSIYSAKRAG